jgi:hypothetical protein
MDALLTADMFSPARAAAIKKPVDIVTRRKHWRASGAPRRRAAAARGRRELGAQSARALLRTPENARTVSGMNASAPKRRRERIEITLDAKERELAERFAAVRGLSVSTYLGQLLREEEQRSKLHRLQNP